MDPTATLSPERLLRRLEWRVVRRLDGLLQGDYRSLFRGMGLDFGPAQYEPGDDLRHIEWNVTARLDTPFVREYVEDREITTWLLLDLSPSMAFGPVARRRASSSPRYDHRPCPVTGREPGRRGRLRYRGADGHPTRKWTQPGAAHREGRARQPRGGGRD